MPIHKTHSLHSSADWHRRVLFLILTIGFARLVGLIASPLGLHGDEAQYWAWSRDFDWGYFSKPPMIAWLIGLTTALFGNSEWAVRLSSPLLHPLVAYVIFRTARFVYDGRTGFWAAGLYFLMPAVWLSSGIVSTDVPLLLCWALALNAFVHLRETPTVKWAALMGLAFGFGMLSKYAMLFFLPATALAFILDAKTRRALLSRQGLTALLLAGLVMAPNMVWNARHDFATLNHTIANANLEKDRFHPGELFQFLISQLGVFGPVSFLMMMFAAVWGVRGKSRRETTLLALFVLAPLLIISLEALLSRANANWAVTAYIAGSILTARIGLAIVPRLLKAALWLNVILGSILALAALLPGFADRLGQANAFKRLRGWPQTEAALREIVRQGYNGQAFQAVATDNRLVFYDLNYYGLARKTGVPLKMWLKRKGAHNHAEATNPLPASTLKNGPVLLVNHYTDYAPLFEEDFKQIRRIGEINIDLGGGKTRRLALWVGTGYTPTQKSDR